LSGVEEVEKMVVEVMDGTSQVHQGLAVEGAEVDISRSDGSSRLLNNS